MFVIVKYLAGKSKTPPKPQRKRHCRLRFLMLRQLPPSGLGRTRRRPRPQRLQTASFVPHFAICSPKGYQYFIPKVYHSNLIFKVNSTLFLWCPWKRAQIRVSTFTNWLKHYNLREVVIHCQPQIRKQHRTL